MSKKSITLSTKNINEIFKSLQKKLEREKSKLKKAGKEPYFIFRNYTYLGIVWLTKKEFQKFDGSK